MKILHVGILSPHVHRIMRMLSAAGHGGEHVLAGERPLSAGLGEFNAVILHGANLMWDQVDYYASVGLPVVGWLWNELWLDMGEEQTRGRQALDKCALVVGPRGSLASAMVPEKYHGILPLVDSAVFSPPLQVQHSIRYLLARLLDRDPANLYWSREVREALAGIHGVQQVTGHATPAEMARLYQESEVVVACREDCGPSYTVVEACLCGAIPVVSDTPEIRAEFTDGDQVVGARLATRSPESIRQACVDVLALVRDPDAHQAEVRRNLEHFAGWTMQAQAPALVRRLLLLVSHSSSALAWEEGGFGP